MRSANNLHGFEAVLAHDHFGGHRFAPTAWEFA